MAQALAVVLLLNGIQISLPRPAVLLDGAVWIPARALCARAGARIMPGRSSSQVIVVASGLPHLFGYTALGGERLEGPVRSINGVTYLRARDLATALGGTCRWRPGIRRCDLALPGAEAVVSVTTIAGGAHYAALSPTSPAAGVTRRAVSGLARVRGPAVPGPLPGPPSEAAVGGPLSPTLFLEADRACVRPGETIWFEVTYSASGLATGTPAPSGTPRVRLVGPDGSEELVSAGPGGSGTQMELSAPGATRWCVPWQPPAEAPRRVWGVWEATALAANGTSSHERTFEVRQGP